MTMRVSALALLALLVAAAPAAAKQSGHLDRSFGKKGRLILSGKQLGGQAARRGMPAKLLPLGKGRFLFAYNNRLFSYEKNGKPNPGFGAAGVVTLQPLAGETLRPTDVAIDPAGRILVSGTASTIGAPGGTGATGTIALPPNRAVVIRLLPNGAPDPSFGSNGVVESTFGFPTPPVPGGRGSYAGPSAEALSIAADASGHPVVTGSWVTAVNECYFVPVNFQTKAYVARFSTAGNLETVDASGPVGAAHWGAALTPAGGERVLFQGYQGVECPRGDPLNQPSDLALLNSSGAVEPSFAPATLTYVRVPRAALDGRGRPVVSGRVETGTVNEFQAQFGTAVTRLRANGSLDPSFGHNGVAMLPAQTESPAAETVRPVAVDASNRPIVGGSASPAAFSLTRLTARGAKDTRFGPNGVATIGFSAATGGHVDTLMVNGAGQILAAGEIELRKWPTATTIAIARYVPAR
jgi:uncharacterized delta-60 repeat protein